MRDAQSVDKIQELHPKVRRSFQDCIEEIENTFDVTVRIIEAFRSWEKQAGYYAIGRTVKGENANAQHPMGDVITNAPPGSGYHLYRMAIDSAPLSPHGSVDYNYDQTKWQSIASKYGLEWGGGWRTFKDRDHYQKTLGHTWHDLLPLYEAKRFIPNTPFLDI